jgi:hypothetical protein
LFLFSCIFCTGDETLKNYNIATKTSICVGLFNGRGTYSSKEIAIYAGKYVGGEKEWRGKGHYLALAMNSYCDEKVGDELYGGKDACTAPF